MKRKKPSILFCLIAGILGAAFVIISALALCLLALALGGE